MSESKFVTLPSGQQAELGKVYRCGGFVGELDADGGFHLVNGYTKMAIFRTVKLETIEAGELIEPFKPAFYWNKFEKEIVLITALQSNGRYLASDSRLYPKEDLQPVPESERVEYGEEL